MGKQHRREEPATLAELPRSTGSQPVAEQPSHRLERDVQRCLLDHPDLQFSSLVVRRVRDGVCLEGVLEVEGFCPDVSSLAQRVAGVSQVLNHLVVRRPPQKG